MVILTQRRHPAIVSAWRWRRWRQRRCDPVAAETILAENSIDETTIAAAAQAAMDSVTPISDTRGSARYRNMMVRNLTRQAVTDVWQQIGGFENCGQSLTNKAVPTPQFSQ